MSIDDEKRRLLHFFQKVDQGLHQTFANRASLLLLAGVEFLLALYRETNTYPHLLAKGIVGNFDRHQRQDESLHKQARLLMEAFRQKDQQEALAYLETKKGTDEVPCNMTEIVPATYEGRIKHLFLAVDQEQWGTYEPATYTLQLHETAQAGDDDLLEVAARQTLLQLGYRGVVITDAMGVQDLLQFMQQQGYANAAQAISEASVRAILAGNDIVLCPIQPERLAAVVTTMTAAVQSGRISQERLRQSLRRIIMLKVRMGCSCCQPEHKISHERKQDKATRITRFFSPVPIPCESLPGAECLPGSMCRPVDAAQPLVLD